MRKSRHIWTIAALIGVVLLVAVGCRARDMYTGPVEQGLLPPVERIIRVVEDGGRLEWSHARDLIAFDRKDGDGVYGVWTMRPDGSEQTCLTCDLEVLDGLHAGQPAWHPSGDWILFQAEKRDNPGNSLRARPGLGVENDVWVMPSDGSRAFRLTDLPRDSAVLHPHFSRGGGQMVWAERLQPPPEGVPLGGEWGIRLADFVVDGQGAPSVENSRLIQPGGPVFYETHGFTQDDSGLIFTANMEPGQPA